MYDFFKDVWHWIEGHPWYAAGGIGGVGLLLLLLHSRNSSSGSPAQTFGQAMQWQRLLGKQQVALINAQNRPAVAGVQSGTAQARIAAGAQTAQSRIAASIAALTARLGNQQNAANLTEALKLQTLEGQQAENLQNILGHQQYSFQSLLGNQQYNLFGQQEPLINTELQNSFQEQMGQLSSQNWGQELAAWLQDAMTFGPGPMPSMPQYP